MKEVPKTVIATLAVVLMAATAVAQPPEGRRGQGRDRQRGFDGGRGRLVVPLMAALDADGDGEISANEIERAVAALKKLDTDGDGKLTRRELRPQGRRSARGGPAGPGGPGPRQGRRPDPAQFAQRIMSRDQNGDGKLSKDELPERMQRRFDRMDANSDGVIDKQEIERAAERLGRARNRSPDRGGDRPRRPRRPSAEE